MTTEETGPTWHVETAGPGPELVPRPQWSVANNDEVFAYFDSPELAAHRRDELNSREALIAQQERTIAERDEKIAEYVALMELQHRRFIEQLPRWRAEGKIGELEWPDLGKEYTWLVDRAEKAEQDLTAARERIAELEARQ